MVPLFEWREFTTHQRGWVEAGDQQTREEVQQAHSALRPRFRLLGLEFLVQGLRLDADLDGKLH